VDRRTRMAELERLDRDLHRPARGARFRQGAGSGPVQRDAVCYSRTPATQRDDCVHIKTVGQASPA
jgi:hypothetical protein